MSTELQIDLEDFIRGQSDCSKGIPHKDGQGYSYDRGYAAEYEHEQNMTAHSEAQHAS